MKKAINIEKTVYINSKIAIAAMAAINFGLICLTGIWANQTFSPDALSINIFHPIDFYRAIGLGVMALLAAPGNTIHGKDLAWGTIIGGFATTVLSPDFGTKGLGALVTILGIGMLFTSK